MRSFCLALALLVSCTFVFAQPAPPSDSMPDLEHFTPDQVDKALDPCTDFFQYACSKWVKSNPIPADQAAWGTFSKLAIWNVAAVRNTLEQAAAPGADSRTEAARPAPLVLPATMACSLIGAVAAVSTPGPLLPGTTTAPETAWSATLPEHAPRRHPTISLPGRKSPAQKRFR